MYFSKEVLDLYELIQAESDPGERAGLMLELAEVFVQDTDDTDPYLGEDVHDLVSEVIHSRMLAERSAMMLARVLMRALPSYIQDHADPEADTSKVN